MGFFFRTKTQNRGILRIRLIISVLVFSMAAAFCMCGCKAKEVPQFSDDTMFTPGAQIRGCCTPLNDVPKLLNDAISSFW